MMVCYQKQRTTASLSIEELKSVMKRNSLGFSFNGQFDSLKYFGQQPV